MTRTRLALPDIPTPTQGRLQHNHRPVPAHALSNLGCARHALRSICRFWPVQAHQRENAQTAHSEYRRVPRILGRKCKLSLNRMWLWMLLISGATTSTSKCPLCQGTDKFFNINFRPSLWRRYIAISHIKNALLAFVPASEESLQNAEQDLCIANSRSNNSPPGLPSLRRSRVGTIHTDWMASANCSIGATSTCSRIERDSHAARIRSSTYKPLPSSRPV